MSEIFTEVREAVTMRQVAEHLGFEVNRSGFIHSPFSTDKTASCKLYDRSFYDFSSNTGGDLIKFAASVLEVNNWSACQYIVEAFGLPFDLSGSADNREQIRRREQERQSQQEKEQRFKEAWRSEVDRLKTWENIYQRAIEEKIFPPLSDLQAFTVGELQKVVHKLDWLCIYGIRREQEEILKERWYNLGGYD